jgi:exopolysaccharide biosynthesis polyprenyl glycosylphosphotransferase
VAVILALLEGSGIFFAVCAATIWARPVVSTWTDAVALLGNALLFSLCCVTALYYAEFYDLRSARGFAGFGPRVLRSLSLAVILLAALSTSFPDRQVPWALASWGLALMVTLPLPLRAMSCRVMQHRPFCARVLIVGRNPLAYQLIREIEAQPHLGYAILGLADDATASNAPPVRYPVLGPLAHLGKIIEQVRPDRIIIALTERRQTLPVADLLESLARRIVVEHGAEVYERLTGKIALEALTPSDLIFCKNFRKTGLELAVARGLSLLVSLVALIGLAPVLALIALAIRVDSKGPVVFVQRRVGAAGRHFNLIKFRTMRPVDRETSLWERDNAHRITRVGRWLRRGRLDELPQFVNVLRGDMNLVGPRPHPVANFELFVDNIPYYPLRSLVTPGVTGWAQVRYGYANTLEEETEKMRYDLYYIKHMSIWLDLRILVDTITMTLPGRRSHSADACHLEEREALRAA